MIIMPCPPLSRQDAFFFLGSRGTGARGVDDLNFVCSFITIFMMTSLILENKINERFGKII